MEANTSTDTQIIQKLNLSLDRTDSGRLDITFQYEIGDQVTELEIEVPTNVKITSATGFRNKDTAWKWDGMATEPSLAGEYHTNSATTAGIRYVDSGDWAIITRPTSTASWRYRGNTPIEFTREYSVDSPGAISSDGAVAYLGPYRRYSYDGDEQPLELIVPEVAELAERPEDIFEAISNAADHLEVGGYQGEVLMIAAPSAEVQWGAAGWQKGREGFWALDSAKLTNPNNTWIHEYVHTRQGPRLDRSLEWLNEGTTTYYATLCSIQQGLVSFDTGRRYLETSRHSGAVLSDPSTWPAEQTKYTKARRVVAALDCKLRQHTDGVADFRTVWRELNANHSEARYDSFKSALDRTIGWNPELEEWLSRYVQSTDVPDLPSEPSAFGLREPTPDIVLGDEEPESSEDEPTRAEDEEEPPGKEPQKPEVGPEKGSVTECPACSEDVDSDAEFCPVCGTSVGRMCYICGTAAPGQKYCPECGTELVQSCGVCGTENPGDGEYCRRCGTEL